ncbi:hypothetical protein ACFY4C_37495 [Actinomadura viridis]|uniref:hypothetical protein n=1 Tax=Actinomadura viridis TaxID=58110 RepID=UPI003698A5BE
MALDIIGKVRERSAAGDREARAYIDGLDRAIVSENVRRLGDLERTVLDAARDKFELIDSREHIELSRLRDDRHICAHPAFVQLDKVFEPTPELVRAHLTTAVDALLSKTPTPGKAALERFKRDFDSNSYPQSSDDVANYLRETFYRNGKTSMRRSLSELIIKYCLRSFEKPMLGERASVSAQALSRVSPDLFAQALSSVVRKWEEGTGFRDDELLALVGRLGEMGEVWAVLPDSSRVRAVSAVEHAPTEDLIKYGVFYADLTGRPAATAVAKRANSLNDAQLLAIVEHTRISPTIIECALENLRGSPSYRAAEFRMENLVLPVASRFAPGHLAVLVEVFIANPEVHNAAAMPDLMLEIYREAGHLLPHSAPIWHELRCWVEEKNGIEAYDFTADGHYHYTKLRALISEYPPF